MIAAGIMAMAAVTAPSGAIAPIAAAVPIASEGAPLHGPAVVILWASWCASCKAELRRIPRLVAAASPLPIRTLAIDPPPTARPLLAERGLSPAGAYADGRSPGIVLREWGGPDAMLPVAVAIDRTDRVCGRKLGLLGTDDLREWARRCR